MLDQGANKEEETNYGADDRRKKRRYPMELEVRYRMLYGRQIANTGCGRTVNMSSSGVWFTTEAPLGIGLPIELSVTWPALLDGRCPLKLVVYGCVVRSTDRSAVVGIERYEFRTLASGVLERPEENCLPTVA